MSITGLRELDVIATIGPKSASDRMITRMLELGVSIFRINGSHESVENIAIYSRKINQLVRGKAKVLVDLPGNKIRTRNLEFPLTFSIGDEIELERHQINCEGFVDALTVGEELLANDGLYKFDILKLSKEKITLKCRSNGELGNNKGLYAKTKSPMPFLLDKDREIIQLLKQAPIDYLGLSFVRSPEDVHEVQDLLQCPPEKFFVKVETKEAVQGLLSILNVSRQILIDRGDLSADIGVIQVPAVQDRVIREAQNRKVKVALATQFLHSMVEREVPLVAEVEAIYHAVRMGIDAIQVSEETSVGYYPEKVIETINAIESSIAASLKV